MALSDLDIDYIHVIHHVILPVTMSHQRKAESNQPLCTHHISTDMILDKLF